ncbi:hypothetical protein DACRYDRAFT_89647 [Dacryopinax primogenitus]|uniref:HCP-like protein n=1 Tax=Dacryopinax primogenitus (strain DJM 731) TaxID=1858805 RepID=M5G4B4_DACPD|nr:uncharacterized protein DACRYDRAFT_89647 [Dacryopinax primogenitus]EJU00662.1 hypothetical protein DACRYDRAFT_89647 [Dacryopinax primogenitus]
MLYWAVVAEAGHEIAQNNIAYLLDKGISVVLLECKLADVILGEDYRMMNHTSSSALLYWTCSAAQNNINMLIKVGNYYYHGLSIANALIPEHLVKVAGYYQSAVESQLSALVMWNLGWMYKNGLGIPQDFHLAKCYYDLAMETNPGGYLPVTLSLIKLYARSIWYTILGSKNHGLSLWDLWDATDEHWYLRNGSHRGQWRRDDGRMQLASQMDKLQIIGTWWVKATQGCVMFFYSIEQHCWV